MDELRLKVMQATSLIPGNVLENLELFSSFNFDKLLNKDF